MLDSGVVLQVLAALAPDRRNPTYVVESTAATPIAWIGFPAGPWSVGDPFARTALDDVPNPPIEVRRTDALRLLAHHDALTTHTDEVRLGWAWVVGRATVGGTARPVRLPLLNAPVRVETIGRTARIAAVGPWSLWPLVEDPDVASQLESSAQFGGGGLTATTSEARLRDFTQLAGWVNSVLAASGMPAASRMLPPAVSPLTHRQDHGVAVVAGLGLYVDRPVDMRRSRDTLNAWSGDEYAGASAFASMYGVRHLAPAGPLPPISRAEDLLDSVRGAFARPGASPPAPRRVVARKPPAEPLVEGDSVRGPFPLTEGQRAVVRSARAEPVTVVSGPPGTGKSQTAAAVALDAIARGESVLIATQSRAAAEVLAGLLGSVPGPDPVVFGAGMPSASLARTLADGIPPVRPDGRRLVLERAEQHLRALGGAVDVDLGDVVASDRWRDLALTQPTLAHDVPGVLGVDAALDLAAAREWLELADPGGGGPGGGGWWRRRRARRAERELRAAAGVAAHVPLATIADAIGLASARERARRAQQRPRGEGDRRLEAFAEAADDADRAWADLLDKEVRRRVRTAERSAVSELARALRRGAAARRHDLARIDIVALTRALPLWVGTLGDIETLLPPAAAAFDLVILDEASQIDQISASAALLRARRALVIGDPRQLRFVSFVADSAIAAAVERFGAHSLAARLDVRRVSAFDLAAGLAPVHFLDEHFRSLPHLIGFSAERFYDRQLHVATRNPATESERAIEVRHLPDGQRVDGVNQAEVAAAVDELRRLLDGDAHTSVGLISPYRAQVDAIADAIGDAIPSAVLGRRVRVGTVHEFQGGECDVVIASFGIGGAGDRGRGFLEDPNLFNVLVTRARKRVIALVSGDVPARGLFADYVRWAEQAPPSPVGREPASAWAASLAEVLRDAGLGVRCDYPVGRWTIDLVVGDDARALAVMTGIHPDGVAAHAERHAALRRGGWRQAEAFRSTDDGDAVAAALWLRGLLATAAPA